MQAFTRETITTSDGYQLGARLYRPDTRAAQVQAKVIIVPAMSVPQSYYDAFAQWLQQQGFIVATFDYRGIGESRYGSLRGFKADILDWARLDCPAMIDFIDAQLPDKPLYYIGHSLGGQIIPLIPNYKKITAVINVASGSGYWLASSPQLKRYSWWLWFFVAPAALRIFKYFPGGRLKKLGDLPYGAMYQWRQWCLNPDYAVGVEGQEVRELYQQVEIPITSLSFADDALLSRRSIDLLLQYYTSAPKRVFHLAPKSMGEKSVGHVGFFRERCRSGFWEPYVLPVINSG